MTEDLRTHEPQQLARCRRGPGPGPGQLLVEVAAAGVNYVDTRHRIGLQPIPLPFVPGREGAGTVTAIGPEVSTVAAGNRVAWATSRGSYAERALVPADRAVPGWSNAALTQRCQRVAGHVLGSVATQVSAPLGDTPCGLRRELRRGPARSG